MGNVHDTIKNKKTGRHMYNRYKNIKKIGLVLIGCVLAVFVIANVRIRSVDSYRKQFSNVSDNRQTQAENSDNTRKDTKQDNPGDGTDNSISAINNSESDLGGIETEVKDEESAGNSSQYNSDGNKSDADSTDTESNSGADSGRTDINNNTGTSGNNNSQNTKPAGKVISCTIEIRCDNATARKDSITNPGIRDAIPDDGTILGVTTYTGREGFTVYDVLVAVAAMHDPVIPIVANADRSYVSSINNLSEKNVGPTSGWTYRVNGVLPMMAANQYTVKDGDVIRWIYVCQWGDM